MAQTDLHKDSDSPLVRLASALCAEAAARHERRALVLAGEEDWCRAAAAGLLPRLAADGLWIGDGAPQDVHGLTNAQAPRMLGTEIGTLVYDAHSGLDPDALGAALGTVRGGGLVVLLTPPLAAWPRFPDPEHRRLAVALYPLQAVTGRYLGRLSRLLRESADALVVEQGRPPPPVPPTKPLPTPAPSESPPYRTRDQRRAVEAILQVVWGHRRRPAVLTSDRGRGKSAALGIAAARIMAEGARRIVVTGPRYEAVAAVFDHARRLLPHVETGDARRLRSDHAQLEFLAPDALARQLPPADLVLVDEAAALPTPVLDRLLQRYARIVFATTVHGYEGTGRGFAIRFGRRLEECTPDYHAVTLNEPIRWAEGDPVERLAFRVLLLDATPAPDVAVADAAPRTCSISHVDRDALAADETLLAELFGLLVLAHYRTAPFDLRHLLDGPNIELHLVRHGTHVVAAAAVALEGGFDATMSRAIWLGCRRPRGHLMAQSLAAHVGLEDAPQRRGARVMRIAVHPAAQRRGLGRALLDHLALRARTLGLDYLGASFGATPELLGFWRACGHRPVRVGMRREASSGEHSVMMLRPLSDAGQALFAAARERFLHHLPEQLAEPLDDVEAPLASALLPHGGHRKTAPMQAADWGELIAFAYGRRGYEVTLSAIRTLVLNVLGEPRNGALIDAEARALLITKVIQRRPWAEVVDACGLSGKAAAVAALRRALQPLVWALGEPWVRERIAELQANETGDVAEGALAKTEAGTVTVPATGPTDTDT